MSYSLGSGVHVFFVGVVLEVQMKRRRFIFLCLGFKYPFLGRCDH